MKAQYRLVIVKVIHTIVWIFYNIVTCYMAFAVVSNKINKCFWLGIAAFCIEGALLLIFKNTCPLTILARRYSDSQKDNFDIYIPEWLAKHNKIIYSTILGLILLLLFYRLLTG